MRRRSKDGNSRLAIVAIAICAMITFPILMIPVGLRQSTPAGVLVGRAYADTYPDEEQDEVLFEDWAITSENDLPDDVQKQEEDGEDEPPVTDFPTPGVGEDGLIYLQEGMVLDESFFSDYDFEEAKYSSLLTAQIVQTYDSSELPIEILDTTTFTPTDEDMYISTSKTILKEEPNMDSVTVADIDRSKKVTRISKGSTWSLVRTEEGVKGYLLNKSLSWNMVFNDIDRTVWVDAWDLKLRSEPSTDSKVLKLLDRYTRLHCSGVANNEWYHVTTDDGKEGYVYVSYTTTKAPPTPTPKPTPKPKRSGGGGGSSGGGGGSSGGGGGGDNNYTPPKITGKNGQSIVNIAESMLGVKYVWCGESKSGVDCSGLVVYCYRQIGVGVPHQSNSIRYYGAGVKRSDIRLGDVIVYDLKGADNVADHVAIYAGNGQVIHASSSKGKVVWGNLDMGSILTIRRLIAS